MKNLIYAVLMLMSLSLGVQAQNVERKGNTFTQVTNKKSSGKEVKTQYTYTDSKGNTYPIYLSGTGKAFILKVSKKSGKEYKQYMPEVGKQINPEAYKNKK